MSDIQYQTEGLILRLEKSSIFDGDGIRTVVFVKGCPLVCKWCSTPESLSSKIETFGGTTYGKMMTVEEVMKEVRKDSLFYFQSGGGITLSGGEILSQPRFATNLLRACRYEGINTAIETSLFTNFDVIEEVFSHVDTAFIDLKIMNDDDHKKYCNVSNQLILDNLLKTNELDGNYKIIIRRPVIVGVNDSNEEMQHFAEFCAKLKRLKHVQLLPYHSLGKETYNKMGLTYEFPDLKAPSEEQMSAHKNLVEAVGIKVVI